MKYKIGDWIIYNNKEWSNKWKNYKGISLYGKIGKIIDKEKTYKCPYLVKFKKYIKSYGGNGTLWCLETSITSFDQLKLKKFLSNEFTD